jgi:hypothetical protein
MLTALVPDPAPPIHLPFGTTFELPPLRQRFTRADGECLFREVPVPLFAEIPFRGLWKKHRAEFYERGYGLRQHNEAWFLHQWLKRGAGGYFLTSIGQESLLRVQSQTAPEAPIVLKNLVSLPPELETLLFDYQVHPARQILRAITQGSGEYGYPGAWDCSDLGTGKTYQVLAACIASGLEIAVICPRSVIMAWRRAFAHFKFPARMIRNYESLATGRRDYVKMEHYEVEKGKKMRRFQWQLDPKDTVLIFDEAHKVKVAGTLNQGLAIAAIRQRFPAVFVSGTMASNPTHMRATGRAVGLHHDDATYVQFLNRNGCYGKNKSGKGWKFCGDTKDGEFAGRRILASLHRTIFPARGARTRIEDLGDRFPETQIIAEAFETGEAAQIQQAFRDAQYAIEKLRAQGDINDDEVRNLRMSAYIRAWHASERLKVEAIIEMVHDELEENRSVALFVNFTDVREELMKKLNTRCAIYGTQHQRERDYWIDEFQADRQRVIVCNIAAGGVGISLHDLNGKHARTSIILPTNRVVDVTQALGRVHRAGGRSRSRQIILFAADTVEESICERLRNKMGQISTLNDGDLYPEDKF